MYIKEVDLEEKTQNINLVINDIKYKMNIYLRNYLPINELLLDTFNELVSAYNDYKTVSLFRKNDTIIAFIKYAHKDFPNFPIQVMLKYNGGNRVHGFVGNLPIAAKLLDKNRFFYDPKLRFGHELKKVLTESERENRKFIEGFYEYAVIDIGSKDIITIGKYNPDIKWFDQIIKLTRDNTIIRPNILNNHLNKIINIVKSNADVIQKIHSINTIILNNVHYRQLKDSMLSMLDNIINNYDLVSIPWLIVDPIGLMSREFYELLVNPNKLDMDSNIDLKQFISYLIKILIRDVIARDLITHLKNRVKYVHVKELYLSAYAYRLLNNFGVKKILKTADTYALLKSDNKLINIVDRQQFDLFKNGFNFKMGEFLVENLSIKNVETRYKIFYI